jgi:hypothetical protein
MVKVWFPAGRGDAQSARGIVQPDGCWMRIGEQDPRIRRGIMWKALFTTFLVCIALTGCSPAGPAAATVSEETYLRAVMAEDLIAYANIDAPSLDHIAILDDGGMEVRLFPDQPLVHNGVRAQIGVDFPFQEGDTVRYEWQLRFPVDFQPDPENRWWIIAEWHDQPDTSLGETWETHPVRSAIIMFTFAEEDGEPVLGVHYGPGQPLIGTIPITAGEWMSFAAVIHWSQGEDGSMQVYLGDADQPIHSASGPNMYNAVQHYFLVGLYRHREIALESRLQVRGIRIHQVE